MSSDSSRWRSSSEYDYVDHLTAPEVGWEWLRRNQNYQRDYAELGDPLDVSPSISEEVGRRWGLRFPNLSCAEVHRSKTILAGRGRHGLGGPDAGSDFLWCG